MSINSFFTDTLGANLANARWSWGARDPMNNRIYLRVWEDEVRPTSNGERVLVAVDNPRRNSSGWGERNRHLAQLQTGTEGFGVVCTAVDPNTQDVRKIKTFDKTTLLLLGALEKDNGRTYARIEGRVPVVAIARQQTAQSTLTDDLKAILRTKYEPTTKEALVNARVGQGKFRLEVLKLWGNRCCVTGAMTLDAIRASHIKPWSESTDEERLDPYNGLPLTANLDALFDAGLISFDETGVMIVSSKLSDDEREIFCVHDSSLTKAPPRETAMYLAGHRQERFQK